MSDYAIDVSKLKKLYIKDFVIKEMKDLVIGDQDVKFLIIGTDCDFSVIEEIFIPTFKNSKGYINIIIVMDNDRVYRIVSNDGNVIFVDITKEN